MTGVTGIIISDRTRILIRLSGPESQPFIEAVKVAQQTGANTRDALQSVAAQTLKAALQLCLPIPGEETDSQHWVSGDNLLNSADGNTVAMAPDSANEDTFFSLPAFDDADHQQDFGFS